MIRFAILVVSLMIATQPALAHAPIKGIGTFYNGVLHPILVPAHLLLLIGLGLLLGQHGPRQSRYGWFVFVFVFWVGLAAAHVFGGRIPEVVVLLVALAAGALVALARPFGTAVIVLLAGAAGLGIGFDSSPDGIQPDKAWLAAAGVAIGGVLVLSFIGGGVAALSRPWQRIGIRIAGSWVVASAGIVLALMLVGPKAGG